MGRLQGLGELGVGVHELRATLPRGTLHDAVWGHLWSIYLQALGGRGMCGFVQFPLLSRQQSEGPWTSHFLIAQSGLMGGASDAEAQGARASLVSHYLGAFLLLPRVSPSRRMGWSYFPQYPGK